MKNIFKYLIEIFLFDKQIVAIYSISFLHLLWIFVCMDNAIPIFNPLNILSENSI